LVRSPGNAQTLPLHHPTEKDEKNDEQLAGRIIIIAAFGDVASVGGTALATYLHCALSKLKKKMFLDRHTLF
jgi:hypothetical protein